MDPMFIVLLIVGGVITGGAAIFSAYYWLKHEDGIEKIKGFFK